MDLSEAAAGSPAHRHPWEIARLWLLRRLIHDRVHLEAGDLVVDIGCGDAFVIGELARVYPSVRFYGVDSALTGTVAERLRRELPENVSLHTSLDDLPPLARPASLILLMDVLEHIDDDRAFLIDLRSRSIVDGSTNLIVTVPAFQLLFSSHDALLRHFRRYSNQQLRRHLQAAGLQVQAIGYFFASLLPIRVLQVIREKIVPPSPTSDIGLSREAGGPISAALISRLLIADAWALLALQRLGIAVPGLSNYAVCRTSA